MHLDDPPRDPRDAGHGGHRNPAPPTPGELFRVAGRNEYLVVHTLELVASGDRAPPRFLVRTAVGTRWLLVSKDDSLDACRWIGSPLPVDPEAPQG